MQTNKILMVLFLVGMTTTSNAQFWKKLTKKAQEAAEQTVERKVAEKTERETDKTFDTVFNNKGKLFKSKKAEKLETYSFTHQYVMDIISDKDTTNITYYLSSEHDYLGSSFRPRKDQEYFTVMDLSNSAVHTFLNLDGQRSMTSFKIDLDEIVKENINASEYTIYATGQTKKILGYECLEYQISGNKIAGTTWITEEADVTFQKAFSTLQKDSKLTNGINQSWVSVVEGLSLEMKMTDYTKKKTKYVKTICTNLEEINFSINTLEYDNSF